MKVEINNLKAVKNYASKMKVSTSYIYKLVREDKMKSVDIDGVKFIDTMKFPSIPQNK